MRNAIFFILVFGFFHVKAQQTPALEPVVDSLGIYTLTEKSTGVHRWTAIINSISSKKFKIPG
jgi:hypothetical protein